MQALQFLNDPCRQRQNEKIQYVPHTNVHMDIHTYITLYSNVVFIKATQYSDSTISVMYRNIRRNY